MALTRPRAYQIYDIDYKQATRVVTVSNITLAGGAPNTVDSVSLAVNDRILVTGQSTASQNGIYIVATLGTGSNGTWTRSIDTDATGELLAGTIVMVTEGAVYQDTQWKLITNDPITIGVTGLVFVQNYSANSISSGTSNVTVLDSSSVLISSAGQANVVKVDAANITISANIIPSANVVYSLGTPTSRFKDLWISNNTIYLGNTTLESSNNSLFVNGAQVATVTAGDNLSLTGNLVASGNVTANGNVAGTYILGNGSFLTGIAASYGNANVAEYLSSGTDTSNIVTTGNISGTYILGNVAFATGIPATYSNTNVADYLASGAVSSNIITTGNVAGTYLLGNVAFATGIPATYGNANVAAYLASGTDTSNIVTTANVLGGNVVATNWVKSQDISATGNAYIDGFISVTGNLYVANVVSQGNLTVDDPLLYLTANAPYPYNYDIGFFSQFQTSPGDPTQANGYQHTGFVKDQTDGVWKLFSNVLPEPTSTINFNDAVYDALLAGSVSATGNISAAGNVTGNYFLGNGSGLTGLAAVTSNTAITVTANAQPNITSVGTLTSLDVTGNTSGGNLLTTGLISATGNVTGNYFIGNGSLLTGITGGSGGTVYFQDTAPTSPSSGDIWIVGNTAVQLIYFSDGNSSQWAEMEAFETYGGSNVTNSPGGSIYQIQYNSGTGNFAGSSGLTFDGSTLAVTGTISSTGNIISDSNVYVSGLVSAATFSASGNVTGGNVVTSGLISAVGNVTGGNVVTSGLISAVGNVTGGNVVTSGRISATGNITSTGNISGTYLLGNAYFVSGLSPTKIYNGTTEANIGTPGGNANISVGGVSNVAVFASTGLFVTGVVSASGNITGGNLSVGVGTATVGGIVNANANGVGNIGSQTTYFNTVFAQATSAQYADLAEFYEADAEYLPGTVLEFGGEREVTLATSGTTAVAGVVSTKPAYSMNAGCPGIPVSIALQGRVPCGVVGPVRKGDLMISAGNGLAKATKTPTFGQIIGKALENYSNTEPGVIEIAVGRL